VSREREEPLRRGVSDASSHLLRLGVNIGQPKSVFARTTADRSGSAFLRPARTLETCRDVEEGLTPEMMEGVDVHYARQIEDVLAVALPLLAARPQLLPAATKLSATTAA
jgi:hypothetical protein